MIQLPSQVKVGPYLYQVHHRDEEWYDQTESHGQCHNSKQQIDVYVTGNDRVDLDTLWHEINHALWWMFNLEEKKDDEEKIVRTLSTGQLMVLVDNPQLQKLFREVVFHAHPKHEECAYTTSILP